MPLPKFALITTICLLASLGGLSAAHAQATTFDFNALPAQTASPLTLTQDGMTVTFTDDLGLPAPGKPYYDDGQYAVGTVEAGYSSRFSGNVLSSFYGYSGARHPLVILFQKPVREISLDFGTDHAPGAIPPVFLSAYQGKALVGTQTDMPQTLVFSPEGSLDFSSATPFDSVTLSAGPSQFLMVDNVHVNVSPVAAVPEASPAAVFAVGLAGLAGLAAWARRRRCPGRA